MIYFLIFIVLFAGLVLCIWFATWNERRLMKLDEAERQVQEGERPAPYKMEPRE